MEEDEEYDSDSDSTVLLTDYVEKPEKIDFKRRRLSNLHDKANLSDEFEDENTAPPEVNLARRSDKNWQIIKYFASLSEINNSNIQNNDSRNLRSLDFNENISSQVPNNFQTNQSIISERNTTHINNNDQIICLDSDEEAQTDDKFQDNIIQSVETSASNVYINNSNSLHKPAPITNRRATTDCIDRNEKQLNTNLSQALEEHAKIRVFKPSAINSRRATTHLGGNNLNCNIFSMKESESNDYKSITSWLPKSQCADVNTSTDASADCNTITGISAAFRDKNTHSTSLLTSKKPLKTDTDQNNSLGNNDFRQDISTFLNVTTHKRFGSNKETQKEPKRIKIDVKSTDPEQFNKNTSTDSEITTLKESEQLETSEQYVRSEMCVTIAERKAINNQIESEKTTCNENKASDAQNTTGEVNEKRAFVDAIDEKLKTTANNIKSGKTTPNKYIQITALNANEKLEGSEIHVNVSRDKHKAKNDQSERTDGHDENKARHLENTTSAVNENSLPTLKTFSNDCENRETRKENILQETSEIFEKEGESKVQDTEVTDGAQHRHGIHRDKRAFVDAIDEKSKSTANDTEPGKTTPNKYIQITALNVNEKLEASKVRMYLLSDKLKASNNKSERTDEHDENKSGHLENTTSAVNENSLPTLKTFSNDCENRETRKENILQETSEIFEKKGASKVQDTEVTDGAQHIESVVQDKQGTSEVIDKRKVNKVRVNQDATKEVDEFETSLMHDEQRTCEVYNKQNTNKVQDGAQDKHEGSKVHSEHKINGIYDHHETTKHLDESTANEAQHMPQTSKTLDKLDMRKSGDKQEMKKIQDNYETTKTQTSAKHNMNTTLNMQKTSKDMAKAVEIYDSQKKDKVDDPLATNNVQDAQTPSVALDKETSEPDNKQGVSKVSENNVNEIHDKQETQKLDNENKISESTNVQETIQENDTPREVSRNEKEDYNDRVLKFQVGFFTLVKEYLKDRFPESAMELHNLIETLIIDTRNGQVQTDVRYSCPKCSRVSNYSSRILNNIENEDNIVNVEGSQKCGFCNGIKKLHNSYLKRFLCKMHIKHDKRDVVKTVSSGAMHATQAEQTREEQKTLTGEIDISHSQTTSDAKTGSESASLAAVVAVNNCSSIDHDKQVKNYCRRANTPNYVIYDAAKKHTVPTEIFSKKHPLPDICSSIDSNVEKDAVNRPTSSVAIGIDTIKLTCKVSDQDKPIIKGNEISAQSKHGHADEEALSKTDLAGSNKRKSEENHKEITEHKRPKTVAEENNAQGVNNLTAIDGQSNIQRIDKLANERPNKVQIISIQRIMSHRIERLNKESDLDNDKVNSTVHSQPYDKNTHEKSSYELTEMFQRNKSDNIITDEAEELDKKDKHFSKDVNRAINEVAIENMLNKESHVKEDENDKGNINDSNNPPAKSVPEADEAKQMNNSKENDKVERDVLKPLMDCFTIIKNSVKEKEGTPKNAENENEIAPESASKTRSTIRNDRSNSLESLQNRDDRKIVMKYVCPICTTIYVYPSILLRHMKDRHNPNLTKIPENCERLQCPFCRILLSNKNYNKHVRLNHAEKFEESFDVLENSNTNIGKNKSNDSFKNTIFLNRQNTESSKASESTTCKNACSVTDKIITTNNSTTQEKKTKRSELKYQHLIKRMKIGDVNNDAQDDINGDENEELDPDEDNTQDNSIENENDSSATIKTGEIISRRGPRSGKGSANVKHTQPCYPKTDKSTESAALRNTLRNEEECASSNCNDKNLDTIEDSDVYSLRNDATNNINETCHGENNSSKSGKMKPKKSNSEENMNNRGDDEKHSRRRISNESESSNSDGINNEETIPSTDGTFTASCSGEHGKQNSDQICMRYENNDRQSTENSTTSASLYGDKRSAKNTESSQTGGSNNDKGEETDSEEYCIKASNDTVKKRNERITKLFGDENEASVSNKIKSNDYARSEHSNRTTKTERSRGSRYRKRKVTVKQYTENAESSDSDWIISNDDSSDSYDKKFCPIKKNHAVRKLFISKNERSTKNRRNEKSCFPDSRNKEIGSELLTKCSSSQSTETDEINDDETIKPWKYSVKKKKERLSKLFGDDNETCVSDKLSEKDDIPADSENNGQNDRCTGIEEGNKENVPSNCVQKVPSDDETLKVSKHMVKKRMEHISKYFADDEALLQNSDSNQQTEDSVDIRTKVINVNEEYVTECNVELPEISDNATNNENCEKDHQDTSKDCDMGGADRNNIPAVAEEEYVNTVNAEKSRDDDRIEINMIDNLLKELVSDDHQNGACTETVDDDDGHRKSEVRGESQATLESTVQTCFENIRITNVISVEGKIHVFVCQECNYGTDTYDDAIRHCQNHYNLIEDKVTYCFVCQINYDTVCFEKHQASHDKYLGNMKIKFSYQWLFTNWQAIFENDHISLSDAEDMQVKSIYKTFCVKMTVKTSGPWHSAVYLCAKCNTCVPPLDIEKHAQQKCTFMNYPCRTCDRVFSTYELRTHHEIYHTDDSPKVFKTIVFNDHNEENFNSKLIKIKALSKKKPESVDIFKCLCGLCFISLKRFKLHFVDCDSELNDGKMCPKCTGKRKFSTAELEEHLLLHHSLLNYEIRVQKITFQQVINSSEREIPLENSDAVELSIKRDMLKHESLTQNAGEENCRENLDNTEGEYHNNRINETVPETTGVTTKNAAMTKDGPFTHNSDEGNRREHIDNVEEKDINKDPINETSELLTQSTDDGDNTRENIVNPDSTADDATQIRSNDEDLIIKRDMLKDEILSQNTENEDINSDRINQTVPEIPDTTADDGTQMRSNDEDLIIKRDMLKDEILSQNTENEDINSDRINQTVPEIPGTTADGPQIRSNDEDLIIKKDMLKDEMLSQNSDKEDINSNQINKSVPEIPDTKAQISFNDEDMIIKRDMLKDETLTQNTNEENSQEIPDSDATVEIIRAESSQEIETIEDSQEVMEVEQSLHQIEIGDSQEIDEVQGSDDPITIDDSDEDDDIEFIGETFPNTTKIFPLWNCSKT